MNGITTHPEQVRASREMLLIGFEERPEVRIYDFPAQNDDYRYQLSNDSEEAFQWLEDRVGRMETYQPPYAIVCDLQWLLDDRFDLTHTLSGHPDLRYVPVIALSTQRSTVEKSMLAEHGIDDCYSLPVTWNQVSARLEFLNQYKSKLLEYEQAKEPENWAMSMPLAKRLFDLIAVLLCMPLLVPVCLLIALAIRLESKGPVLYRSKRVGTGYRVFEFFKFRSMYQDADKRLHELAHLNQYGENQLFVKLARDPRVTRIGRIIRKYSLDEFPQILNILRGDMSVVGNRPLPLYEAEQLTKEEYCARFLAPAGLTGLWQVTKRGRSDMSAEERIALDVAYARQRYSIWKDLKIVLKTATAFIQKEDV